MIDLSLCNCEECPLKGSIQVPGEGTGEESQYDIVIVGIAPARAETRERRPLVGWSGSLLRKILPKLNITSFYLTNTVLCPLKEEMPSADETLAVMCCNKRLLAEVEACNPEVVVAMGNVPLAALTGKDYKVRSVQGRILPGLVAPVLPVINPASLSRRAEEFFDFVDGLRSAPKLLNGTYQTASRPNYTIVNQDNYADILQKIENANLISVDLETTGRGFYPYGRDPDKIRCAVVAVDEKTVFIIPGNSSPYFEEHPNLVDDNRLRHVLSNCRCITHNGPFDLGFFNQAGFKVKIFFDTFLGHYCLDEREYSHSLKALGHKYTGAPDWEDELKQFLPNKNSSYDLIPDDKLYEYAAWDGTTTYQLSEGVGFREKVANTRPYREILGPAANMFSDIRHRGILVDVELLMNLDEILEEDLNVQMEELEKLAEVRGLNPFSPMEVAELLFDTLGFQPIYGYGRSTAAKHLKLIGGPICDKILEIREFGKLKSTYVVGLANFVDKDFRIHPFTKLHGTVTGRISTTDPNIMNVHKKGGVRKLYLPEPGRLILEADQKQMELRCLALESKDEHLMEIIRKFDAGEGPDPHTIVNIQLNERTGKEWDRDKAKAGVFGRAYGRGKRDFIESYQMTEKDADELIAIIDRLFPGLKGYNDRIKKEVHEKGYCTSFFGRKRRFGLVLDDNKSECYRQGANFYPQSMGSDLNLLCMLHLWEIKDRWDIHPLFPVHDSIVMDIPDTSVVPEIKEEMERYTMELVNNKIGFKVDCSVGKSWGEAEKLKL